jgi:hypothetical protein
VVVEGDIKRFVWMALVAPIVVLAMANSASAAEKAHHPTEALARFNQCPTENPGAPVCFIAEAYGGEFQIGNIDIPITRPIVLQGGLESINSGDLGFTSASDGESLVKSAQMMAGGILGLVKAGHYPQYLRNFCMSFPNNSECRVTATPELVGLPTVNVIDLVTESSTALALPLRFHLKNPFLGDKCYIGSAPNPVTPMYGTGVEPELGIEPEDKGQTGHAEEVVGGLVIYDDELVDNTFSGPRAEGCGGPQSLIVDREIDEKQALPSLSGHNRSRLISTLYTVTAEAVRESET